MNATSSFIFILLNANTSYQSGPQIAAHLLVKVNMRIFETPFSPWVQYFMQFSKVKVYIRTSNQKTRKAVPKRKTDHRKRCSVSSYPSTEQKLIIFQWGGEGDAGGMVSYSPPIRQEFLEFFFQRKNFQMGRRREK